MAMTENRRNTFVAIFVILGLTALGWLIFKFGDLPMLMSRYNTRQVSIYFSEAPGIKENTPVLFRGFQVGRVVSVSPPVLMADLDNPAQQYYQVPVSTAIDMEYTLPREAVPKVYRRGLGGSFIEFSLAGAPQSGQVVNAGDKLKGYLAESSEFISESTQRKLDELIASLTRLSENLHGQLTPLSPEVVDANPGQTQPNVTTAFMRLDSALKNLNTIIGDPENQKNFKSGLADFTRLASQLQTVAEDAGKLISKTSQAVERVDQATGQANSTFQKTAASIQSAADELAVSLKTTNQLLQGVSRGEGTVGRLVKDPRLYDSLNDAVENLNKALAELRGLLADWKESGAKVKLK